MRGHLSSKGSPRDIGMNVALPEMGALCRAVSRHQTRNPDLETDVVVYEPVSDRVAFVAELARVRLRSSPPPQRRIALILANYLAVMDAC